MEDTLRFELRHKAIIDRFGRNDLLGRVSTPEELAFLNELGVRVLGLLGSAT